MPLFEYRCTDCQHEFEALVRDASWPECPGVRSSQTREAAERRFGPRFRLAIAADFLGLPAL